MCEDIEAQEPTTSEQAPANKNQCDDVGSRVEDAAAQKARQDARRQCICKWIGKVAYDYWFITVLVCGGIGAAVGLILYAPIAQGNAHLQGDDWTWRFQNTGMIFSSVTAVACYLLVLCVMAGLFSDLFVLILFGFALVGLVAGCVGLNDMLSGDRERYSADETNLLAIDPSRVQFASGITAACYVGLFIGCGMGAIGSQI